MPGNITVDMSGAQEYLDQLKGGITEKVVERALSVESEILTARMAVEAPRLMVERRWKKRSRKHMQDDMQISPLSVVSNGAYMMAVGPQLKPGDGHAYAPLVNDGTSRIKANPFVERTIEAVGEAAINAAIDELRKGLGIGG